MVFRVLVIGAGAQGAACASILTRIRGVDEVVLGDIDLDLAQKVKDKIGSDKVRVAKIDARKKQEILRFAKGADTIINMVPPRFNLNIMESALDVGAHYVDTASGPNYKIYPIDRMVLEQLSLEDEFKKKGLTALISCGYTPGLSNVLARYLCDTMQHVTHIKFRVGVKIVEGAVPEIIKPIAEYTEILWPTWSPEVSFLYRATEPVIFDRGEYKRVEPFSGLEEYTFPDPIGRCMNTYVDHEEPVTVPLFINKGLEYVDYKNPPDILAWALIKMGFAEDRHVEVDGCRVVPRDVLLKLLKKPVHIFLEETPEKLRSRSIDVICEAIIIEVSGRDDGGHVVKRLIFNNFVPPRDVEERIALYKRFGTTRVQVGLPAAIGALICSEGRAVPGVIAPEALNPDLFLKKFEELGYPVRFTIEEEYRS